MKYRKIHFGPGAGWDKIAGNKEWFCVDIDPNRATGKLGTVDFNKSFKSLPFSDNSCEAIYASHTFEHINPGVMPSIFKECFRVLQPDGCIRIVVPDPLESIKQYQSGNLEFELFKRRAAKHRREYGWEPTIFELMREDFVSMSGQPILGKLALAHQNSWDNETMIACLMRAGFHKKNIYTLGFKLSKMSYFKFEENYDSEANQHYRSQYFEAIK